MLANTPQLNETSKRTIDEMKKDLDSREKSKQFKLLGLYNVQKGFINR